MNMWFLEESVFESMVNSDYMPTAAEQAEFEARMHLENENGPRIMSFSNGIAQIDINGIVTDAPNFMAMLFGSGNTTYREIQSALAMAESDSKTKEIVFNINSPGGQATSDMLATMEAIYNAQKPTRAVVGNVAASAAYGLAAQADEIVAQNRMSKVGSIGLVMTTRNDKETIQITSTNAPNKRIDASSEEGQKAIREMMDPMEAIFIDSIAQGRGVSSDTVKKDFGRGGIVIAANAVKNGMIDKISNVEPVPKGMKAASNKNETAALGGVKKESRKMDLNTLKAEHPAVYQAAVQDGIAQERDRVEAHLTLGKASGDMDTALEAVADGSQLTAKLQAKYMAAGFNKRDLEARQSDSDNADAADTTAKVTDTIEAEEDKVLAAVEKLMGVQSNG